METVLRLNPSTILLIVDKNNIKYINRVCKEQPWGDKISIHLDNKGLGPIVAKACYKNSNLLVVPGNSPLISYKSLLKMTVDTAPVTWVHNKLFYLRKEYLDSIDNLSIIDKHQIILSEPEMLVINTHGDLDKANDFLKDKEKKMSWIRKSIKKN